MKESYSNIHTPLRVLTDEDLDSMSPREILEWSEACDRANPYYTPPEKEITEMLRAFTPEELIHWVKHPRITIYGIREALHAVAVGFVDATEKGNTELVQEFALADRTIREVLFLHQFLEFSLRSGKLNQKTATNCG